MLLSNQTKYLNRWRPELNSQLQRAAKIRRPQKDPYHVKEMATPELTRYYTFQWTFLVQNADATKRICLVRFRDIISYTFSRCMGQSNGGFRLADIDQSSRPYGDHCDWQLLLHLDGWKVNNFIIFSNPSAYILRTHMQNCQFICRICTVYNTDWILASDNAFR